MRAMRFYQLFNFIESQLYKFEIILPVQTYLIELFNVSDEVDILKMICL